MVHVLTSIELFKCHQVILYEFVVLWSSTKERCSHVPIFLGPPPRILGLIFRIFFKSRINPYGLIWNDHITTTIARLWFLCRRLVRGWRLWTSLLWITWRWRIPRRWPSRWAWRNWWLLRELKGKIPFLRIRRPWTWGFNDKRMFIVILVHDILFFSSQIHEWNFSNWLEVLLLSAPILPPCIPCFNFHKFPGTWKSFHASQYMYHTRVVFVPVKVHGNRKFLT